MLAPITTSLAAAAMLPRTATLEPIDLQRTRAAIADFRVIGREARAIDAPRIAAVTTSALDPLPGDRMIDMRSLEYNQQRRGPPGAAVDARMSMRLDPGQSSEPDFGVGGIGGALMRVTTALID